MSQGSSIMQHVSGFPSFLRLNNIPFKCIYHNSFIHFSINGYLGCFHTLSIVNNAPMNKGVQISIQVPAFISSGYIHSEMELLAYMVILHLIFWRTSILICIAGVPFYILKNSAQGFQFLNILTNAYYLLLLFKTTTILTSIRRYLLHSGSKITADGDCSHEIKRCLLLGRKVMTNLDSIFKSRHITLPTKVHLVKAMVFPVVMYGCESWTIKKAERPRIDAFELWCWRRLLRVPWIARRSKQFIPKEISPGCSLEGMMLKLKLQYSGHLMWRSNSFEKTLMLGKFEGGRRREQQRMKWLDGITDSNGHEFEQTSVDSEE